MNTKNFLLITIFYLSFISFSNACSCYATTYCEVVNSTNSAVAFKGKVVDNIRYSFNNVAIYIEIEKLYKGDPNTTDTIKLYGGENSAGCQIDLMSRFPVGTTLIAALGGNSFFTNPDSDFENYWETGTSLCNFINLTLENNTLSGAIAPGVSSYNIDEFEKDLYNCNLLNPDLEEIQCEDNNVIIYPNPAKSFVQVSVRFFGSSISKVNIYSTDGKLVKKLDKTPNNNYNLNGLSEGIHIIELVDDVGNRCYRKLLML